MFFPSSNRGVFHLLLGVSMKNIFILNEEPCVLDEVKGFLELSGFSVRTFRSLKQLERVVEYNPPDMIISEISVSDGSGLMYLKKLRGRYRFPFIFLSRKNDESFRILAFEVGADDFVPLPCSPKELVLRVKAIFRRIDYHGEAKQKSDIWRLGQLYLYMDREAHNYYLDGKEVDFTASEWRILSTMTEEPGTLFSRSRLLQNCFDTAIGYDRTIDNHIKNIRSKIGSAWIETVRSYGYRFVCDCYDSIERKKASAE